MAKTYSKQQGLPVPADSPQQQQQQVVPDAGLVIDDSSPASLKLPKSLDIASAAADAEGFSAERRLQLIKSAERRMAPRFLLGIFLTIFINYIDR